MRKFAKTLSVFLVAIMIATLSTGCGGSSGTIDETITKITAKLSGQATKDTDSLGAPIRLGPGKIKKTVDFADDSRVICGFYDNNGNFSTENFENFETDLIDGSYEFDNLKIPENQIKNLIIKIIDGDDELVNVIPFIDKDKEKTIVETITPNTGKKALIIKKAALSGKSQDI
ncbi:MAG: hypothetical protein ACQESP_01325, partial [Candidatus Muiribacteriota bacterium]